MATVPPRATWAPGFVSSAMLNAATKTPLDFMFTGPFLHAYRSTAMTVSHDVYTPVTLFGETYDRPDSNHSTTSFEARIAPATAGIWEFTGATSFNANAGGTLRGVQFRRNAAGSPSGGLVLPEHFEAPLAAREMTVTVPPFRIAMSVGDYVEMFAYQNCGAVLSCNAGQWHTFVQASWIGEI